MVRREAFVGHVDISETDTAFRFELDVPGVGEGAAVSVCVFVSLAFSCGSSVLTAFHRTPVQMTREDLRVRVANGKLQMSGERHGHKEASGERLHRVERSYGKFTRWVCVAGVGVPPPLRHVLHHLRGGVQHP